MPNNLYLSSLIEMSLTPLFSAIVLPQFFCESQAAIRWRFQDTSTQSQMYWVIRKRRQLLFCLIFSISRDFDVWMQLVFCRYRVIQHFVFRSAPANPRWHAQHLKMKHWTAYRMWYGHIWKALAGLVCLIFLKSSLNPVEQVLID